MPISSFDMVASRDVGDVVLATSIWSRASSGLVISILIASVVSSRTFFGRRFLSTLFLDCERIR
jgi:hypothetical protein